MGVGWRVGGRWGPGKAGAHPPVGSSMVTPAAVCVRRYSSVRALRAATPISRSNSSCGRQTGGRGHSSGEDEEPH